MSTSTSAQQAQNVLCPLLGQLAWHVRGGHGSFLTLEFGQPHIELREPIKPRLDAAPRVQRNLMRRRVFIVGDWHLFIQYCDWTISVPGGSLTSKDIGSSSMEECLLDLEGQRLVSVESGSLPNSWRFRFDLRGALELWPSTAYEPSDELWSLHKWNGNITVMRGDGTMTLEKAKPRG